MIEEFVRTHRMGQRIKLKQIAYILSNFKVQFIFYYTGNDKSVVFKIP